ncbi:MAG: hypothetical protein IJP75_08415 [Bacteroidaceae bacterium]|nr:hypothetical protein [Bacteroidaceae bacterium]
MKKILTILSLFFLPFYVCRAQEDSDLVGVLSYMKHAMMFSQTMPQEKVYLHFDNTGYFKGETIWFKAYVVRADNGKPTDMSAVLYVELVNPSGDVVETRKLPIQEGTAHGDIKLDSLYTTGFYEVRAYTRYMTNWGNGGIFSRVFPVFNAPKKDGDYSKMVMDNLGYRKRLPNMRSNDDQNDQENGLKVRFYPEGGKLIKGLPNRVAFLVTDKTGAFLDTKGSLLDDKKQELTLVATIREGKGVFKVIPDGKAVYLRLADRKGKMHDIKLPDAEEEGLAMQMNTLKEEAIETTVYASPSMVGKLLGYTLIHNGKVIQADTVYAERAMMIPFERASMPAGVNQLTFFTADGHIQTERQFFIVPKSQESDTIRIKPEQAYPKPCKKVTINVQAQPNSNLSFSAIDAATMTNGREGNAMTWLLLSSDIKGYISDPGYYFEADDEEHRQAADLLMMVQGWRRYDWALMANAVEQNEGYTLFNDSTAIFTQPIEDKLYVFGKLGQKRKKNTVDGVNLTMTFYNQSGEHLEGTTVTDSVGAYAFALPNMDGEWKLIINTQKDDKDANYFVGIDRHFSPARRWLSTEETKTINLLKPNTFANEESKKAAEEDHEYIPIQKREHVLPTVTVKAKRTRIYDNARAAWESETEAQHYATMYYNTDRDADMFADKGMDLPFLSSWLHMRNPYFGGSGKNMSAFDAETATTDADNTSDFTLNEENTEEGDMSEGEDVTTADPLELDDNETGSIYRYAGLSYKNRPIVWIVDNMYHAITSLGALKFDRFDILQGSAVAQADDDPAGNLMRTEIDEVKSVYVTENSNAYMRYIRVVPSIPNAVTVFVYTHHKFQVKQKGLRNTHFQGYNKPSTFETDDYNTLPPIEDFRRTLWWEPDVKTDAEGKATIEFFNNSSCHEMYISCEGINSEGQFMVNE